MRTHGQRLLVGWFRRVFPHLSPGWLMPPRSIPSQSFSNSAGHTHRNRWNHYRTFNAGGTRDAIFQPFATHPDELPDPKPRRYSAKQEELGWIETSYGVRKGQGSGVCGGREGKWEAISRKTQNPGPGG